jgi:acyl-CoA oxidase
VNILGCYAQTEIGHGSNVAGIETTATLDKATDEFVIHTPSITATKYWPGDMGRFSSHAIVFARLIIDKQDNGV